MSYNLNGQCSQDAFVIYALREKRNGFFVELGSQHPRSINNTFILERELGWRGIMVEADARYQSSYEKERPNSYHVFGQAHKLNYKLLFDQYGAPPQIDYLQVDLEVSNGSTLAALEMLESSIMPSYRFATITFEHDIRRQREGSIFEKTRSISRQILLRAGYFLVFGDVSNEGGDPYEDWYVAPELVNMEGLLKVRDKLAIRGSRIAKEFSL